MELIRLAWRRWKILGKANNDFIARVVAVVFYFTFFVPFALGVRLFGDPLKLRKSFSHWPERQPVGTTLDEARRQF